MSKIPKIPVYSLTVADLNQRDFDRGIARVHLGVIDVNEGDCLEIRGQRTTYVRAIRHYPNDRNRKLLRTDLNTRKNASMSLGDNIYVSRVTSLPSAENLIVTHPEGIRLAADEEFSSFLGRKWSDRYATVGDILPVTLFGAPLDFRVVGYSPDREVVQITEKSKIEIREPTKKEVSPEIEPDETDKTLLQTIKNACEKYGLHVGREDWIFYGRGKKPEETIMARVIRDREESLVSIYEMSLPEDLNMRGRDAFDRLYDDIRRVLPETYKVLVNESHLVRSFELSKMPSPQFS